MGWSSADIPDQKGKTFVVTGSNTGIGFATLSALTTKRARVIIACRNPDKGDAALAAIKARQADANVTVAQLDLSSLASVRTFAERMMAELPRLDVLINNAGVMMTPFGRTADGFETQFGTNVLGHFALTGHLLPLLMASPNARVVTLSSLIHWIGGIDFANLGAEKRYRKIAAYSQSKLGNLLFAYELQRRLAKSGATTVSIGAHPGITRSELARHDKFMNLMVPFIAQKTEDGALPSLMAATAPEVRGGDCVGPGGFLALRGAPNIQKTSARSQNQALAAQFWDVAQRLTGVSYL